jgi:hypothetical protein
MVCQLPLPAFISFCLCYPSLLCTLIAIPILLFRLLTAAFLETLAAFRHTLAMTSLVPTVQATMASSPR